MVQREVEFWHAGVSYSETVKKDLTAVLSLGDAVPQTH